MKPDAAEKAKAAKRGKERNKRNAIKKTDVMPNLRHWLAFVGEDVIEAAQRTARKTRHDVARRMGSSHDDTSRLLFNYLVTRAITKAADMSGISREEARELLPTCDYMQGLPVTYAVLAARQRCMKCNRVFYTCPTCNGWSCECEGIGSGCEAGKCSKHQDAPYVDYCPECGFVYVSHGDLNSATCNSCGAERQIVAELANEDTIEQHKAPLNATHCAVCGKRFYECAQCHGWFCACAQPNGNCDACRKGSMDSSQANIITNQIEIVDDGEDFDRAADAAEHDEVLLTDAQIKAELDQRVVGSADSNWNVDCDDEIPQWHKASDAAEAAAGEGEHYTPCVDH